jgi:hypothetical protein
MQFITRAARAGVRNPNVKRSVQQQRRKKTTAAVDDWANDGTVKALNDLGETNAIIGVIGAVMVVTGLITAITRSVGKKEELNGFTSVSDGQPYTTDPAYEQMTQTYRKFQNMDPISEFKKTGRV